MCRNTPSGSPTAEDVDKFTQAVDQSSHDELSLYVQAQINAQLLKIHNAVSKCDELEQNYHSNVSDIVRKEKERQVLLDEVQYYVTAQQSSLAEAGEGAFITATTSIPPGTVVALYPGLVHLKEYLREDDYLSSILPDPDFMLMARLDEALVDGRSADQVPYNPYSVGHKINHCGPDRKPNVMQVSFDYANDMVFGVKFPRHLRPFVPNKYAREPSLIGRLAVGPTTFMPSVVLLATRHLSDGEELLMDYPLDPDSTNRCALPAWYKPHNEAESRNRWL